MYKVLFKGIKENDENRLNLIFRGSKPDKIIKIPSHLILELKEISKSNQNVISYQNISEVIKVGKESSLLTYNYYFIILYTSIDDKRRGFLIGNEKSKDYVIYFLSPNLFEIPYEEKENYNEDGMAPRINAKNPKNPTNPTQT